MISSSVTFSHIGMIENTPGRSSTSSCSRMRPLPTLTSQSTSLLKLSSMASTTEVVTPVALSCASVAIPLKSTETYSTFCRGLLLRRRTCGRPETYITGSCHSISSWLHRKILRITSLSDVHHTVFLPLGPASTLCNARFRLQSWSDEIFEPRFKRTRQRLAYHWAATSISIGQRAKKKTTHLPQTAFPCLDSSTTKSIVSDPGICVEIGRSINGTLLKLGDPSIRLELC